MPHTDNMTFLELTTCDSLHPTRFLHSSSQQSSKSIPSIQGRSPSWPTHPDSCTVVSPADSPFSFQIHSSSSAQAPSHTHCCINPYPSPPATSEQSKHSVPLPNLTTDSSSQFIHGGGVLDSPLIMRDAFLSHIPISPPPTLQTSTLALPDTGNDLASVHDDSRTVDQGSLSPEGSPSPTSSSAEDVEDSNSYSGGVPPPLSPLSPEWMSTRMHITPEDHALLSVHKQQELFEDIHFYEAGSATCLYPGFNSPPRSAAGSTIALPLDADDSTGSPFPPTEEHSRNALFLPSISPYTTGSLWEPPADSSDLPLSPRATPSSIDFPQLTDTRPHLPLLDIPELYDTHTPCAADPDWPHTSYTVSTMDIDENTPSSPAPALDLFLTPDPSPDPYIHHLHHLSPFQCAVSLPDLDDIDLGPAPSSPSRRSVSSLPDFGMEDDPFSPSSPGQRLLSLPGADTDDYLLPSPSPPSDALPEPYFTVPSQGSSLLLIDDPNDVPPPRSPSPEHFDLDLSLVDLCDDPDLKKLCELRKRAVAGERAARAMEAQMLEQGAVHMRAEARRVRKMEKEKSREIGALLRLKVGQGGRTEGKGERERGKGAKKVISSLSQLVARMMFRRSETFRPLANRRAGCAPRDYVHSSLSQTQVAGDEEADTWTVHDGDKV